MGDGVLVVACAVVIRDVPEQKMVAGNLARIVKDFKTKALW